VGYALSALKDRQDDPTYGDAPWHRVVNAQGRISIVNREFTAQRQADLLRAEGVAVDDKLRLDLDAHLWPGLSLIEIDDIISGSVR
jgi:alkylated DNA nucleotide flippase Atl1